MIDIRLIFNIIQKYSCAFCVSILCIFGVVSNAIGQDAPIQSQYMMNLFLVNPAVAGSNSCLSIRLNARQQWIGVDGAPSTQSFTVHGRGSLKKNFGAWGIGVYNDANGANFHRGAKAACSYNFLTKKRHGMEYRLALGLDVSYAQYGFNSVGFEAENANDPLLNGSGQETSGVPNVAAGLYFYSSDFFVSLSAAQLLQGELDMYRSTLEPTIPMIIFALAGYRFGKTAVIFEPSVMYKMSTAGRTQIDANLRLYFTKVWSGISYKHDLDVGGVGLSCMFGVNLNNKIYVGYIYEYGFSEFQRYNTGVHEIMIGYNFCHGQFNYKDPNGKRSKIKCPAYH